MKSAEELRQMSEKEFKGYCSALMGQCCDAMESETGGLDYGWDWPTLAVIYPDLWAQVVTARREAIRRLQLPFSEEK